MGTCSKAALAWGFEMPQDKLHALLECFRKHAEDGSNSDKESDGGENPDEDNSAKSRDQENNTGSVLGARPANEKEGSAKKRKVEFTSEDAEELYDFIGDEMEPYQQTFYLIIQGRGEDTEETIRIAFAYCGPYHCERWGTENYGTTFKTLGNCSPAGMKKDGWEESLKKFQTAMHFEEAGIELPLKEEWILYINIG